MQGRSPWGGQFCVPSLAFSPDQSSFFETHRIRGHEVCADKRCSLVTVANLLQEATTSHSVGMLGRGMGYANLPDVKAIFVMTRLQIRMRQYPRWGDIITIETYFSADGRLKSRRDWNITNAETGDVLGAATSTWVSVSAATRKPVKMPQDLRHIFPGQDGGGTFSPSEPRHAIAAAETKQKLPEMDEGAELYEGQRLLARRSDIDMNGHVNNVTYLAWALEAVPQDVYKSHRVHQIEIDFKTECQAGATVVPLCQPLAGPSPASACSPAPRAPRHLLHSLRRCEGGARGSHQQELVRCRTVWLPTLDGLMLE